jgi:hypothetical protein
VDKPLTYKFKIKARILECWNILILPPGIYVEYCTNIKKNKRIRRLVMSVITEMKKN